MKKKTSTDKTAATKAPVPANPIPLALLAGLFSGLLVLGVVEMNKSAPEDRYQQDRCFEHRDGMTYARIDRRFEYIKEIQYTYADTESMDNKYIGTNNRGINDFKEVYPFEAPCGKFYDWQLAIKLHDLNKRVDDLEKFNKDFTNSFRRTH